MTVWVIRGGRQLEFVPEALSTNVVAVRFDLREDLTHASQVHIRGLLQQRDPESKTINQDASQLWRFKDEIKKGDLVIMPRQLPTIAVGKIVGNYEYRPQAPLNYVHTRAVEWINHEFNNDTLEQDNHGLRPGFLNSSLTVYRPLSKNGKKPDQNPVLEQRLRVLAINRDDLWDAFISWAKLFYEWELFDQREREYKLRIGEKLAAVKQALRDGNPDWQNLLKTTLKDRDNNLTHWRASDAFLNLDLDTMEEGLRRIWALDSPSTLEQRVQGFQEFGDFETPAVVASILLMGDDPMQYPMYRYTPLKDAFQLIGYSSTQNSSKDTWERYEHALGFWDEFIRQASSRGLHVRDRLDAQSLVWCITQYGRDDLPDDWSEEVKDALISYRNGTETDIPPPPPTDPWSPTNISALAQKLLWQPNHLLLDIIEDLQEKRQFIFYGPPGTGKTYVAREIAKQCKLNGGDFEIVQFHPSYSYEDFVEGYRPTLTDAGQPAFMLVQGPLRRIAKQAQEKPDSSFILIIDELNRGNVAKVFGELYFLLEYRDEKVRLQYGGDDEGFSLPKNLWFICTMNTADRSIALMDAALRRRFYFAPFFPDESPIKGLLRRWLEQEGHDTLAADLVDEANKKLDRDMGIGPSHFMGSGQTLDETRVQRIWNRAVIPYIEEQFFGDEDKLAEFAFDRLKRELAGRTPANDASNAPSANDDTANTC